MMKVFWCGWVFLIFGFTLKGQQDSAVNLEVHFDLDSHRLLYKEKERIDSIMELAPVAVLKSVQIYGHTDSLAGIDYNRNLSKSRVLSILQYLVYKGIDPRIVKTDYYGEEKPKYDNGPGERYKNRRVELFLTIDPSLLPPPEQKLTDLEFKTGDKIRIPNLNFVGNQPIPVWQSFPVLEQLLQVMLQNPDLEIELQGHVCCSDDHELSVQRALMVYNFLRSNGIDRSRMTYLGYSNTKPLFKENSETNKAMNRRVEIYVKKNSEEKRKTEEIKATIDIEARVLNIKFFPQKARLYPSSDFMLNLITGMMKESEGLFYEFVIFDNINNNRLTSQRSASLERKIADMGVNRKIFRVRQVSKPAGMPDSPGDNFITVRITQI